MDFPSLNADKLHELYRTGQHDKLTMQFLGLWATFDGSSIVALDADGLAWIDRFVQVFLDLFCQPDYALADRYVVPLLERNMTISNVVAMSSLGTTDAWLERLVRMPRSYVRYLILCSARNRPLVERTGIFNVHGPLACLWHNSYLEAYRASLASPLVWDNLREHVRFEHPAFTEFSTVRFHEAYFGSTYIDQECDRRIREKVNRWARQRCAGQLTVRSRPDPRHIAIVTAFWCKTHSAYRIVSQLVEALRPDYELTLVHLAKEPDDDTSMFQHTGRVLMNRTGLSEHEWLADNSFGMVFFLDVGMSPHSVLLANMRLAPIQICGLGQSVSSFGAEIDYFISGAAVERIDLAAENYSERLVLLPGMGAVHNRPRYELRGTAKPDDALLVNCPWTIQKINYRLLCALQEVLRRAARPVRFRFYPGVPSARRNEFLPMAHDVAAALGVDRVEIVTPRGYDEYMALMEQGELCLDSFPFGGCNVVADGLFLRQPTVAYEGTRWYSRVGPHMLRTVGLGELVAQNESQYVELAVRLIHDDAYRLACQQRLQQVDLDATIFDTSDAQAFRRAVDFLIANHERLQRDPDRSPIHIT